MTLEDKIDKIDICGLTLAELTEEIKLLSEPSYRAGQIYSWLHRQKAASFDEMTNVPKSLKNKLSDRYRITVMDPVRVLVSGIDGTRKYIFSLFDGNVIEAVFMRYRHGNSICISSQVGCRMGCSFCASALGGCVRNLTAAEMCAEVYRAESDTGERVSNIVIMGSGEPFDNYEEAVKFIRMISDGQGLNISARNITLSTCGIVPGILRLAGEGLPVTLAVSLHSPYQDLREKMMPSAKAYKLPEVLDACREYFRKTGRRLSFEYSVIRGVNDSGQCACDLASLLKDMRGHVNLIPVNPVKETGYESPERGTVEAFRDELRKRGINATIRREMGRDINSACGQLRRRHLDAGICTD